MRGVPAHAGARRFRPIWHRQGGHLFRSVVRDPDPSVLLNTHLIPSGALLARRLFADAFPGDGRLQLYRTQFFGHRLTLCRPA